MTPYYLGGYYLIKQKPIDFGSSKSKVVCTCSTCINDSLLDDWSYSWTTKNNSQIKDIKQGYQINDDTVSSIRQWVDEAFDEKKIGWVNLFEDLTKAKEYKSRFFSHLPDTKIVGIYFTEDEGNILLSEFTPQGESAGSIGLYDNLSKKIHEQDSVNELFIGFDIVGVELDGSFHTFYCHDIANDLAERFGLTINQYGLFQAIRQWQSLLDYMNDEQNGFEPVPWFICKVKLVID